MMSLQMVIKSMQKKQNLKNLPSGIKINSEDKFDSTVLCQCIGCSNILKMVKAGKAGKEYTQMLKKYGLTYTFLSWADVVKFLIITVKFEIGTYGCELNAFAETIISKYVENILRNLGILKHENTEKLMHTVKMVLLIHNQVRMFAEAGGRGLHPVNDSIKYLIQSQNLKKSLTNWFKKSNIPKESYEMNGEFLKITMIEYLRLFNAKVEQMGTDKRNELYFWSRLIMDVLPIKETIAIKIPKEILPIFKVLKNVLQVAKLPARIIGDEFVFVSHVYVLGSISLRKDYFQKYINSMIIHTILNFANSQKSKESNKTTHVDLIQIDFIILLFLLIFPNMQNFTKLSRQIKFYIQMNKNYMINTSWDRCRYKSIYENFVCVADEFEEEVWRCLFNKSKFNTIHNRLIQSLGMMYYTMLYRSRIYANNIESYECTDCYHASLQQKWKYCVQNSFFHEQNNNLNNYMCCLCNQFIFTSNGLVTEDSVILCRHCKKIS